MIYKVLCISGYSQRQLPEVWREYPVRAKICRLPWRYKWSSAAAHTGEKDKHELLDLKKWNKMISVREWKKELAGGIDLEQISKLRLSIHAGRPLGTDSFLSKIEKLLGRCVRALPHGRPKIKRKK